MAQGNAQGSLTDVWTYQAPTQANVADQSQVLAAATTGRRKVIIKVAIDADTGVFIRAGGIATNQHFLLGPGEVKVYYTPQQVSAIRAGTANVTVYVEVAT